MEEIIYVPEKRKFRLRRTETTTKGFFYFTRSLWHLHPDGKKWQNLIYYTLFWFVFLPLVMAMDLLLLLLYYMLVGAGEMTKALWKLIQKLVYQAFKSILYPSLRTFLQVALIILLAIILFYRFNYIKDLILHLFDFIAK
jgi:hypothetical protein